MARKTKIEIEFEATTTEFTSGIKQMNSSIKSLNKELKLNDTQLKDNSSNVDLLKQRQNLLKQELEKSSEKVELTNKKLEEAKNIFGEDSDKVRQLTNELTDAKNQQQAIANAINETNKKIILQSEKTIALGSNMQNTGDKIGKVGNKLDNLGNKLSVVGAGVGALAVGTVKASIDFESAFAGVEKTVDGTKEQMAELRQGIIEMSTQLPSSAVEISKVAESAGQLGIKTENIKDFSKVMIDLGNSTNMTSDEASTQLARLANITQMSQNNFDKLGSTIVDLGNNLATTESEITAMSLRLAGAGHQVGMSEAQIMSFAGALSSVGIEAEAGGSAFSKVMIQMQLAVETGGDSLKDFANVSGMSTKAFKKAFKEDASGAIIAFIEGLSKCEAKGTTAIKVLDDMGITEVRLRDSLLRASGASNVFKTSLEIGTNAWNENIALTNEANKRYQTTESQLQILKNEIIANAIAFGDELKPTLVDIMGEAKSLISNVTNVVKSFNNLSTSTKKNIIGFGGMVIAIGPAVKIGGKLISTTGNLISGYGSLIKKAGEWSSKLKISTVTETLATTAKKTQTTATTASTLATTANTGAIATQTTVTGGCTIATNLLKVAMIGLPIIGVIAGIAGLVGMFSEMSDETQQSTNKIKEQKESLNELKKEQQNQLNANLSQIDNVKSLRNELKNLVDDNGKVKDGYKQRVDFILGELNNALGTEYKATDGLIEKYGDLTESVDKLIAKKRANVYLDSLEEQYNEAREKKSNTIKTIAENNKRIIKLEDELKDYYENGGKLSLKGLDTPWVVKKDAELKKIKETTKQEEDILNNYYSIINKYDEAYRIVKTGNVEEIEKLNERVEYSYQNTSNRNIETIKKDIEYEKTNLQSLKEFYKTHQDEMTQKMITESETRLNKLQEDLTATAGIIQISGTNINTITSDTIAQNMALLNNSEEYRKKALQNLEGYLKGITDEEKRKFLENAGIKNADLVINKLNKEGLAEQEGLKILNGYYRGLSNIQMRQKISNAAANISVQFQTNMDKKISLGVNGSHANGLNYVPFNGYIAQLHEGERVLTAKENKAYNREFGVQGILNTRVNRTVTNMQTTNNRNIIVQFYPQQMTESEIDRAKQKIEKDWGVLV